MSGSIGHKICLGLLIIAIIPIALSISSSQSFHLTPLFSITGNEDMETYLKQPIDIFIDQKHSEIYVTDAGNSRIVVFDMDGYYRYQFPAPDKVMATGLAINEYGEILLAIGGRIAVLDFRGNLLEYVDLHGFPYAHETKANRIKIDKQNNYYILDSARQRILVFDPQWNFNLVIDSENLPHIVKNLSHGEKQETPMVDSMSIGDFCVDDESNIYLVDSRASKVFVFDSQGEYQRSIGEPGSLFTTLSFPTGVAVDDQDRVLVTDSTGHGLLGYNKNGRLLFALGGMGRTQGRFYFPRYVLADENGRIYVIEPFLSRIQVLRVEELSKPSAALSSP